NYLTAVGYRALYTNTDENYHTAVGHQALYANDQGVFNTAVGYQSLVDNTDGGYNCGIGMSTLPSNTTGASNTALGYQAGSINTTGDFNTHIGRGAYYDASGLDNTSSLGYGAGGVSDVSDRIEIGNTSVSWIGGEVAWSTYSDARIKDDVQENVPGLAFITRLRPVTYQLNIDAQNALCHPGREIGDWPSKYDIEQIRMSGFIAQEVEQAAVDADYDFSGVDRAADDAGMYSLKYSEFVVPLVKAVQEQQAAIEALQALVADLQAQVAELRDR
ncbi:MAG: tail fiber domain-containing protein, partial [Saprospiraceae bacterium]|nr:tail fiber domain-containing protein [Saprospiraceae bacterium]